MTKEEKTKVLKEAIGKLKVCCAELGICWAVSKIAYWEYKRGDKGDYWYQYKNLKKLGIIKPRKTYHKANWFPLTKKGKQQRIALLKQAIKRLEQ